MAGRVEDDVGTGGGAPRRVRVVGTSGSGKTTTARRIAALLGLPHLELDSLQHQPGWRQAPPEEFAEGLAAFVEASPDGWVIDGNYQQRTTGLLAAADTVVWVDPPRAVVMARVVRRTLGRGLLRRELWNGNREDLRNLVRRDPEENIVLWAWRTFDHNRRRYEAALDDRWVRLRTPRETRRWLASLPTSR